MRRLADMEFVRGAPILVRASLNVPVKDNCVVNTYRLLRAEKTIRTLSEAGARVIVCGHIGREPHESLLPVYTYWKAGVFPEISFSEEVVGARVLSRVRALPPGGILLLENLRRNKGESTNDRNFSKELANLADYFVQDAFDACHRAHASIIGVPVFLPSYAGLLLEEETRELLAALSPKPPSLAIIGGAKIITKAPLIRKLFDRYDHVFVGGAIVHDIFLARGYQIGRSLSSNSTASIQDIAGDKRLIVPIDVLVEDASGARRVTRPDALSAEDTILDAGPETVALLAGLVKKTQTVLWNGPLGNYERGCKEATETLAQAVAQSRGTRVIGGGDTVASIEALNLHRQFTFVSTGGGAMLDFLTAGTLPGIEAIQKKK